jgi:4-amino-4-deoxy-L-arabinose transferase-like glycosyltransferase
LLAVTSTDQTVPPRARNALPLRQQTRRWLGSIPRALIALLVVATVAGVAWALLIPPFQAPDEASHFAYAQSMATRLALPGDPRRPAWSSDQTLADEATGASRLAFSGQSMRPPWTEHSFDAYLAAARRRPSQSDGGGPNPVAVNPPLFYLFSDLAYWASGSENLFGRLYAMRVWGVVLLLGNVLAGWLLAGEALGRRRVVQLVAGAVCGLMPMETFISTSVNPDALMVPLWTFALWLSARLVRRGWRSADAVALCAVTAAAILTKATSYALLPASVLALVLGWCRAPASRRRTTTGAAAAVATLAAPVLAWVAFTKLQGRSAVNTVQAPAGATPRSGFRIGSFLSYLWEFYLPRLPFMSRIEPQNKAAYYIWVKQGWADFGWLDVLLPRWTYGVFAGLTAVVGLASSGLLLVRRSAGRARLLAVFLLALGALLFGLHLTDYRAIIVGQGALLQGRYLLPAIGLFGLAVGLVVRELPWRWGKASAGSIVAALLLLQVLSLATVVKAYYT